MNVDELFGHYSKETLDRFKKYNSENPQVFEAFKRLAKQMKNTGRKKYSAEAIINAIRWEHDLKTTGDVFEINNDFKSVYARLLIYQDRQFEGFFELRVAKNHGIKSEEQQKREAIAG